MIAAPPLDAAAALLFAIFAALAAWAGARAPLFVVPLLVIADPFDVARYAGPTTITVFKAVLIGAAGGLAVRGFALPPRGAARTTLILALLLAAATAATIAVAAMRGPALRESLKALEYALAFAAAYAAVRRAGPATAPLGAAFGLTLAAVAVAALGDFAHPRSGVWIGARAVTRLAGPLEGPNQLAAWLGLMLPALAVTVERTAPVLIGVGTTLLALTLSRTGSVQGLLALTVAALAPPRRTVLLAAGIVTFACATGAYALATHSNDAAAHLASLEQRSDRGTGSRAVLWTAAGRMFAEHPVLGIGAGGFEFAVGHYGAPAGVRTHANSLYLEALADGGIVLGAATIAAAFVPPLLMLRAGPRRRLVFVVGAAGLLLALRGLGDDVTFYTKVGQLWWVLAGVACAFAEDSPPSTAPGTR